MAHRMQTSHLAFRNRKKRNSTTCPKSKKAGFWPEIGWKLRLEGLKEDYGVSASTLREILNRLAAEGFLLAEGRRGFEVAPISVENLRELAELRLLLEQYAMGVSFANADVEREGRVVSGVNRAADGNRPRRAPAVEAL